MRFGRWSICEKREQLYLRCLSSVAGWLVEEVLLSSVYLSVLVHLAQTRLPVISWEISCARCLTCTWGIPYL